MEAKNLGEYINKDNQVVSLNHLPLIDINLFTDNPLLEEVCKDLMNKIHIHYETKPNYKIHIYKHVKIVIENIIKTKIGFSVSLRKGSLSRIPKRYNPNGYKHYSMNLVLNYLNDHNYIEIHKGFYNEKISMQTRVTPKPKIKKLIKKIGITKAQITLDRNIERIILKDTKQNKKKLKDYDENKAIEEMRQFILEYESFISCYKIRFKDEVIKKIIFKRVFNNNSFENGGRYYSWYQNIPSEERSVLMSCDNSPLVEIDYSGLHINMLYALNELPPYENDVYTVKGYEEYRNIFKIALQIAINAKDEKTALQGMRSHLVNHKLHRTIDAKEILNVFRDKHEKISEYFFSGIGLYLQYLDSNMVTYVLKEALKYNIPLLPVHDSFLTRKQDLEFTNKLMVDAGKEVLKVVLPVEVK
jgi:hypothetical protein